MSESTRKQARNDGSSPKIKVYGKVHQSLQAAINLINQDIYYGFCHAKYKYTLKMNLYYIEGSCLIIGERTIG